ncbi:O-antigen ligase family protein [Streptomyces sp. NPDC050560]|uniref:O-antigen ligase family protein n=1 Tax=Streptomyces sp. NPDC050560 TaxID=3365630 RepID=UPI0037B6EF1B
MGYTRDGAAAAGVAVLGACAVWALVTAAADDGRPEGVLLAVLAVAAGYAAGRIGGAVLPVGAPAAGAVAGVGLVVLTPHAARVPDATSPLGDTAGTAGVLALAAGAACCAAWAARRPRTRVLLRVLALAVVGLAAALGSFAGLVASAVVVLASLAAPRMSRRSGLVGLGVAALLAGAGVWAVAGGVLPAGPAASAAGALGSHRVALWHDALGLAGEHPGLGAGPGRFGEVSSVPVGTLPGDGRPHSALLQQAVEQGVVGVLLLGAGFCWLLLALGRSARPAPLVLTAGAALTALAVLAMGGNALSFTTVTAGAGLLAGIATARPLGGAAPAGGAACPGDVPAAR